MVPGPVPSQGVLYGDIDDEQGVKMHITVQLFMELHVLILCSLNIVCKHSHALEYVFILHTSCTFWSSCRVNCISINNHSTIH